MTHPITRLPVLLALVSILPPVGSAQESAVRAARPSILLEAPAPWSADATAVESARFPNLNVSRAVQGNHRTEGAIIGGALLGVPVLIFSIWAQDPDAGGAENLVLNTAVATALGALIGAFIAGAIPKEPRPEPQTAPLTSP